MESVPVPCHPGEVLKELYLLPLSLSAGALAKKLDLPRTRIERLVKGQTSMTPDTALRLARFFNTTEMYWLNMQTSYDLVRAKERTDVSHIPVLDAVG